MREGHYNKFVREMKGKKDVSKKDLRHLLVSDHKAREEKRKKLEKLAKRTKRNREALKNKAIVPASLYHER